MILIRLHECCFVKAVLQEPCEALNSKDISCIQKPLNRKRSNAAGKDLYTSEAGFSTAGMVIALLITLSLIFSAAQVYQINSASAAIQNVADVAALGAMNEVAEFYIVGAVCDAIVLSLSLAGTTVLGLGIVALCVPATAALSEKLIKTGNDIIKARNSFAKKAATGLNKLQKLLPFISAANAESIVSENSGGSMSASYTGLSILLPLEGEEICVGSTDSAEKLSKDIETNQEEIKEIAKKAEEAAEKARKEKEKAYLFDCGNNPKYCMYERAGHLSSISASENPIYHTVDTWSFSVALKRAQAYYPYRIASEAPTDNSVEGQADSVLRKRFYRYANQELSKGYVHEEVENFSAYFPLLPKNTSEMKQTTLYTESVYPIGIDQEGKQSMHAWSACPGLLAQASGGLGSIADMDSEAFSTCTKCNFTVSSFGKIAAATSAVETGFEYHYRAVAEAAKSYQIACEEYSPYAKELKSLTEGLFDQVKEALSEAVSYRLSVAPPGRIGVVSMVINTQSISASENFYSGFVADAGNLGAQAAISAATLASDSSEEGATVISSLLDGVSQNSTVWGVDLASGVLELWSSVLFAYTKGQEALIGGLEKALNFVPLSSESGLGTWAANTLSDLIDTLGFAPAQLDSWKPVLLNTAHVLSQDDSSFSSGLLEIKQRYLSLEGHGSGNLFSSAISQLEASALEGIDLVGSDIVIASIELLGDFGPSIPITIALPPAIVGAAKNFISDIAARLQGIEASVSGVRRWE